MAFRSAQALWRVLAEPDARLRVYLGGMVQRLESKTACFLLRPSQTLYRGSQNVGNSLVPDGDQHQGSTAHGRLDDHSLQSLAL